MSRPPTFKLCRHKPSNRAFVHWRGNRIYLGKWGTTEVREEYVRLISRLTAGTPQADSAPPARPNVPADLTINELLALYVKQHVDPYYIKNGLPTTEAGCIRIALGPLREIWGAMPAREFGPYHLKAVRDAMVGRQWVRTSINRHVGRIRRAFGWGAAEGFLPGNVHSALSAVVGLRRGRSLVKESKPVLPVSGADVESTLPFLSPPVAAMVRLQLLLGCRPGEVCALRPGDVDRTADPWCYRPSSHKTEHHGTHRRIYLGPQSQAVLAPFMQRADDQFCFSPKEGRQAYLDAVGAAATTAGKRRPGARYTTSAYALAIAGAVERANKDAAKHGRPAIPHWHPNQLRHARATELRKRFGLEAAQVVLGHAKADTTQIYAERDFERAAEIMREIG